MPELMLGALRPPSSPATLRAKGGAQRVWQVLAAASVAAVAFVVKVPEFVLPMAPDLGVYHQAGATVLAGSPPYAGVWDNIAPAVYFVHAALLAVFGQSWVDKCLPALGPLGCTHLGANAFDLVYSFALGAALYGAARRAGWDAPTGVIAAALGVGFSELSFLNRGGNTPQKLALLPLVLAAASYLQSRRARSSAWLWLAGLCLGLAVALRPSAILLSAAIAVHTLWWLQGNPRDKGTQLLVTTGLIAAGGLLVWAPLVAYMILTGVMPDFVHAVLNYNGVRLLRDASGGGTDPFSGLRDHVKAMMTGTALLWVAGGAGVLGLVAGRQARLSTLVGLWALADLSTLLVVHEYVQLIPSLSLAGAWALRTAWQQFGSPRATLATGLSARLLLVGLCAVALLGTNGHQASVTLRAWNERVLPRFSTSPDELLASYVRSESEGRSIYIWSESAHIYVLSEQTPASRFVNIAPLTRTVPGVFERRAQLVADLRANPPGLILVHPVEGEARDQALVPLSSFPELSRLLDMCYEEERKIPRSTGEWKSYRRLDRSGCR